MQPQMVYPSKNEIFGLAPFEGLLCGAPAVVSDDCGCGEPYSKAQAGLLLHPMGIMPPWGELYAYYLKTTKLLQPWFDADAVIYKKIFA